MLDRATNPDGMTNLFGPGQMCVIRKHGAFGMAGGQPGQVGQNVVVRADGRVEALGHIGQADMLPGDVFEIHTPGGGGFGVP